MGKRVENKWDWPGRERSALLVMGLAFLLGGLAGCLLAALSGGEGAGQLRDYLADYLRLAGQDGVEARFWSLLWGHLQNLLIVLVLSMSTLGVVGLPVLFMVHGFFFAFSTGCCCRVFGGAGLFPAFALFGLSALLWVPALFLTATQGLARSRGMLLGQAAAGFSCPRLALGGGLMLAAALAERWVAPVLLRAAVQVVL